MRVHDLQKVVEDDRARVSATFSWENSDRPQRTIYFETERQYGELLSANPNAFLLAAMAPARHHSEARVLIEGTICPELRNGLQTAMLVLDEWYARSPREETEIEATGGFAPPPLSTSPRTASFMSGGIDALSTLRCNRLDFPLDHPRSIRNCFFVHGLDVGGYELLPDNRENSQTAIASLKKFGAKAQFNLIPVHTNVRQLDDDDHFVFEQFYGAVLAAVAHSFAPHISRTLIASGPSINELEPMGSHPMLDPQYSSCNMSIQHDGVRFRRIEKVELISEWEEGLQRLRACFDAFRPADTINCGACEKCYRTMTELLVLGKLSQCPTYPQNDISPDDLETLHGVQPANLPDDRAGQLRIVYKMITPGNVPYWRELITPLESVGRRDLAQIIRGKLEQYDSRFRNTERREAIKQMDEVFTGGKLFKLRQKLLEGRRRVVL